MKANLFVFSIFLFFTSITLFCQTDTIVINDTIMVIDNSIPEYIDAFYKADYSTCVSEAEELLKNSSIDGFLYYYLLNSYASLGDSVGFLRVAGTVSPEVDILFIFRDEKIRTMLGEKVFTDLQKPFIADAINRCSNADFDYMCILSDCYLNTSRYRSLYRFYFSDQEKMKTFLDAQSLLDSLNFFMLQQTIKSKGLPTQNKVGKTGMNQYMLCVQHFSKANFVNTKKDIRKLYRRGEITSLDYAYYIDRYKVYRNKKQIFATQLMRDSYGALIFQPVRKPKSVDKRRRKMGFDTTAEEYLKMISN